MIIMGTLKSHEWPVINAIVKKTKRTNDDEPLKMKSCGFHYQWLLGFSPGTLGWEGRGG